MAHDVDMDPENSAAHLNGGLVRGPAEVRSEIEREMAWHEKLFDESWDCVMRASPEEIEAMLREADATAAGTRPVGAALGVLVGLAARTTHSTKAGGRAAFKALRRLFSSSHGAFRPVERAIGLSAASIALTLVAIQLLLPARAADEGDHMWVRSDGLASGDSWHWQNTGTFEAQVPGARAETGRIAPATSLAPASSGQGGKADNAALLVAPLPTQAVHKTGGISESLVGTASGEIPIADAEVGRPETAAQYSLAIMALGFACSGGEGQVDCMLTQAARPAQRVLLSDNLTAGFRNWYSASLASGSGVVCVIGPDSQARPDCRVMPPSTGGRDSLGGFSVTAGIRTMSGSIRLTERLDKERPMNP